jgi:uncharacterized protein (DUF2236 family)
MAPSIRRMMSSWHDYLLTAFSGSPDGRPLWIEKLAEGKDAGYFGPGSAVWFVHGSTPVIVAGIRALLMQTLHPGAMAGVHDWSRYREDPLGRLSGTVRWVLTTSFADTDVAQQSSAFVTSLHRRVAGSYTDSSGTTHPYSAGDPDLLSWVHIVFTEAFLSCHQAWGGPIPGGPDQYVAEWATAGDLMGVANPPHSEAELRAQIAAFDPVLVSDERVADAVRFIRRPPLPRSLIPGYHLIFAAAVATLAPKYRRMLGLRRAWWPARTTARIALWFLGRLLGRPAESETYARRRLDRLTAASAQ